MTTTQTGNNYKIFDEMTQLQIDLERVLKSIIEQAGSKIQPEKQEEMQKKIEGTKQIIERYKSKYA